MRGMENPRDYLEDITEEEYKKKGVDFVGPLFEVIAKIHGENKPIKTKDSKKTHKNIDFRDLRENN